VHRSKLYHGPRPGEPRRDEQHRSRLEIPARFAAESPRAVIPTSSQPGRLLPSGDCYAAVSLPGTTITVPSSRTQTLLADLHNRQPTVTIPA
jgi:hypothetical protein